MLAQKLNMSEEDAEKWVVNMIRNARLDAKIDSEKGHVVMGTLGVSPYQQVRAAHSRYNKNGNYKNNINNKQPQTTSKIVTKAMGAFQDRCK